MGISLELTEQSTNQFFSQLREDFLKGFEEYKQINAPFPYVKASDLKEELGISQTYLEKLCNHGLKRVMLEEDDKYVWYSRIQLSELMDSLAE